MLSSLESQLSDALKQVLGGADGLPDAALRWELPKDATFGDLSNAVSFKLAPQRKQAPQQIAAALAADLMSRLRQSGLARWCDRVEAKGGYLNLFLSAQALARVVRDILRARNRYGNRTPSPPRSINIEFVSANPTGPLSVAHGRQAAVGDVLSRLLRCQGVRVTAEYYLNDEGRQIELLGQSLRARYLELLGRSEPFPEDGYHGAYVAEIARELVGRYGDRFVNVPEAQALPTFMSDGMAQLMGDIRRDLSYFGLAFDRWSSQRWLRTSGRIDAALSTLKARDVLYEAEEATWLASTRFGDDKDRVVRKRDGELTYLAPDIAYHQWKFERGYDELLNLWGPDHHGYIQRLKAAVTALGLPADHLKIRIVQLVTLSRQGKPIPMSKRQGAFVTFREIMDEVGVDATRFFYVMRTMDSHLDFDLELAKSQSQDNPVYYVQYAHARICSILAKARVAWWATLRPHLRLLRQPEETTLMRLLTQYPVMLRLCAEALEPHGVTVYLRKLAETFHIFYDKHRVISPDQRLSAARLALVRATRHVLANGLGLLGVSAPRQM